MKIEHGIVGLILFLVTVFTVNTIQINSSLKVISGVMQTWDASITPKNCDPDCVDMTPAQLKVLLQNQK